MALAADGTVYCWGGNDEGQLGNDGWDSSDTPVKVFAGDYDGDYLGENHYVDNKIVAIAAGYNHSMALAADGAVYCWGNND